MSTSIEKHILVEVIEMCDYHLKENCFHPEKVHRGLIAIPCEVHECTHCTNESWQKKKIQEQMEYHYGIVKLSKQELPSFNIQNENSIEAKRSSITKIFG